MATSDQTFQIPLPILNPTTATSSILPVQTSSFGIQDLIDQILQNTDLAVVYGVIFMFILVIFSHLQLGINTIAGIGVAGFVIWYIVARQVRNQTDDYLQLEQKVSVLVPEPEYFWMDARLIELYYNLLDFYELAPNQFSTSLQCADNVLHLRHDIEIGLGDTCPNDISVALTNAKRSIESMSSIMVTVPGLVGSTIYQDLLQAGLDQLAILLDEHITFMKSACPNFLETYTVDVLPVLGVRTVLGG